MIPQPPQRFDHLLLVENHFDLPQKCLLYFDIKAIGHYTLQRCQTIMKSFKESELKILPSGDFELLGIHCKSCGEIIFGLHPLCPNCSSPEYEQITLEKKGKIRNYTILHIPPHQDWKGPVPYVVAEIELPGGAVTTTQLVDTDPTNTSIDIGMQVQIELREADRDEDGESIMIYVAKLSA